LDNLEIVIKLDPVNDGFKKMPDFGNVKDNAALIVGTNGKHRVAGDDEVASILDQLEGNSEGVPIGDLYIAVLDDRKVLKLGTSRYLVGSIMVLKMAGSGAIGAGLLEFDKKKILKEVESRIVTLSTGTEEFSAFQLD